MSTNIPNSLNCYGSVTSAAGTKVAGSGFSVTHNGVGDNTINLAQPVDATQCAVICTARQGTFGSLSVVHTSDSAKQVLGFDAAGMAADVDFDFLVLNCPNT